MYIKVHHSIKGQDPFGWRVEKTFVNGHLVYNGAEVDESFHGQELRFV